MTCTRPEQCTNQKWCEENERCEMDREQVHIVIGDFLIAQVFDTREAAEESVKTRKRLSPEKTWHIESWQVSI